MDQFIACHGRAGHALLLDTRTLEMAWLPLPRDVAVIVCNTMTKHVLATDGYNARRADCEAGVRALAARLPADPRAARRDAGRAGGEPRRAARARVPPLPPRRDRERAGRWRPPPRCAPATSTPFGALMRASHASMRDDFEISTPELDVMVESAMRRRRDDRRAHDRRRLRRLHGQPGAGRRRRRPSRPRCGAGYEAATGRVPEIYTCVRGSTAPGRLDA